MAIGAFALLSCALILPMHPLVRPRSPQCMMKSYDTSKPYDAASSPEPLGEEEEELMATLVEPAALVVEPSGEAEQTLPPSSLTPQLGLVSEERFARLLLLDVVVDEAVDNC